MDWSKAFRLIAFVVVAAIYVAVRFWNLAADCLWFDEIFSVQAAERSWTSILDFIALDLIHPPLFYLLLKVWIAIRGESLVWLRSLPVLFSIIAIVPFWLLCRALRLSYWTALLAFLLIAVNGSLIKYAQEVRMYSMLMCISLFSIWLFIRYFQNQKGIAALTLINVLLVYTHYFGWFVILIQVIILIVTLLPQRFPSSDKSRSRKLIAISAIVGIPLLCFIPWLVAVTRTASARSDLGQNIGWIQRPGLLEIARLALSIIEPFYYAVTSTDAMSMYAISIPVLLVAVVSIVIYFANSKAADSERPLMVLLCAFCIFPLLIVFIASWLLPYSIWGARHLVIVFVPISILIAHSTLRLSNYKLRTLLVTTLMLFTCYAFVAQARPMTTSIWCGFEPIGDKLQTQLRGPVYVFEDLAAYHLWFRFRDFPDAQFRPRVIKVDDFPGMPEDKAYFIPRGSENEFLTHGSLPLNAGPFWIVYRARSFDLTQPPLDTLTASGLKITRREVYAGDESKIYAVYLVPVNN